MKARHPDYTARVITLINPRRRMAIRFACAGAAAQYRPIEMEMPCAARHSEMFFAIPHSWLSR